MATILDKLSVRLTERLHTHAFCTYRQHNNIQVKRICLEDDVTVVALLWEGGDPSISTGLQVYRNVLAGFMRQGRTRYGKD